MQIRFLLPAVIVAVLLIAIGAAPALAAMPDGARPAIVWQSLLGGSGYDDGQSIEPTSDGGYILVGCSMSNMSGDVAGLNHGNADLWAVKLDAAGLIQWQQLLGGSGSEYGFSMQQAADGGYILLGPSDSSQSGDVTGRSHGGTDIWAVKLSGAGAIQWQTLLGGSGWDGGRAVQQTTDLGYVLVGYSDSSLNGDVTGLNHGIMDLWTVKLNATGGIQWQTLLGGSKYDAGTSVRQTADGGYILAGESRSSASGNVTGTTRGKEDAWIVRLNATGAVQQEYLLGGSERDLGISVRQMADGRYVLLGYSESSASGDVSGTGGGLSDTWS